MHIVKATKKATNYEILHNESLLFKFVKFIFRSTKDIAKATKSNKFNDYGMTIYTGRQGTGYSVSR